MLGTGTARHGILSDYENARSSCTEYSYEIFMSLSSTVRAAFDSVESRRMQR